MLAHTLLLGILGLLGCGFRDFGLRFVRCYIDWLFCGFPDSVFQTFIECSLLRLLGMGFYGCKARGSKTVELCFVYLV